MPAWSRAWVVVIVGLGLAAAVAVFLDLPAPVRPVATIAFVLLGPGIAIARLLHLESRLAEFTLGFALSVALAGLVAGAILYLGMWSPTRALVILAAITIAALALDADLVPRSAWHQLWRAIRGRARFLAGLEGSTPGPDAAPPGEPKPADALPAAAPSPATASEGGLAPARPRAPSAAATQGLPPPPVAVVRRGPRQRPVAVPPTRPGGRRQTLGEDPLERSDLSRGMRSTIDHVIDDLAERKDGPPA